MPDDAAARKIRLLVLDVDGVLSDGLIHIDGRGVESKAFHTRDGAGIAIWRKLGHEVAIITGRSSMTVQHRADELGIRHVFQGVRDKMKVLGTLLNELGLAASEAAAMGDDLPDLPMLRLAGYPIAVADAAREVREMAAFVTLRPGGRGAVREAIEHLLKAQDRWEEALALFD
jgi:3-deoxy-D-manno-octulosonate 8-phosphate phosphatase (KDO 8-P phosphatase)